MKWRKTGRVSVLVVPEKEGAAFSFKISLLFLRLGLALSGLALIFFIIMSFSWNTLLKKAHIYDRLAEENQELLKEHERLITLQNRVEQLQKLEEQIRRVLGVEALTGRDNPLSSVPRAEPLAPEINRMALPVERSTPRAVETARPLEALRFAEPPILKDLDIPSLWPVRGFISRNFETNTVVPGRSHGGVDLAAAEGTAIRATAGGIVLWSGWSPIYGNTLILAHASNYFSMYGHNQDVLVTLHQRVERGDPIALVGNTGQSSAPHLHFEIWRGQLPIDPANLLMPM